MPQRLRGEQSLCTASASVANEINRKGCRTRDDTSLGLTTHGRQLKVAAGFEKSNSLSPSLSIHGGQIACESDTTVLRKGAQYGVHREAGHFWPITHNP